MAVIARSLRNVPMRGYFSACCRRLTRMLAICDRIGSVVESRVRLTSILLAVVFLSALHESRANEPRLCKEGEKSEAAEGLWGHISSCDRREIVAGKWDECVFLQKKTYDTVFALPDADEARRRFADALSRKFCSGDAVDRVKWFVSLGELVRQEGSVGGERLGTMSPKDDPEGRFRKVQNELAKQICLRFVDTPGYLEQYHHWHAWRRLWLNGDNNVGQMWYSFEVNAARVKHGDELFWWACRQCMLIIYATGRDDLIPRSEREYEFLPERCREWNEWFRTKGCFLRPSPSAPRWFFDAQLESTGYGYAPFFLERGELPALIYPSSVPFPDWPGESVPRNLGR